MQPPGWWTQRCDGQQRKQAEDRSAVPGLVVLTIVTGPPAGGKSTWVLEHAQPGDIVVDFDRLAVALTGEGGVAHDHPAPVMAVARATRTAAIEAAIKQANCTDVYIIHSSPGQRRMAEYQALGAKVVTIDPGKDVVRERCKTERPRRMFAAIDQWYRDRGQATTKVDGSTKARSGSPSFSFPSTPTSSRSW